MIVVAILLGAAYALAQTGGASWFAAGVFVLLTGLTVTYVAVTLSTTRRRLGALPEGGVGVSNSPVVAGLLVTLVVALFLVPISLAVAWAASGHRPVTAAGPLFLLVVSVIAFVPVVVGAARGRYRLGGLRLTPEQVSYSSFVRQHTLRWDELGEVVVHPSLPRLELRAARSSAEGSAGQAEQLDVPTGLLRTDAEELRELIDFYRTHPRDRHELRGDAALTRARRTRA